MASAIVASSILVSSSSVIFVMKDFPRCPGELGGSASDIAAAELGEAAMTVKISSRQYLLDPLSRRYSLSCA